METSEKDIIRKALQIIQSYTGPKLRIMEVCGTHTHEIFRLGIRQLLPDNIELISGPGCPVCVTPADFIDEAVWLSLKAGAAICTFGDLLRVPGSVHSLAAARSLSGNVQIVYTPLDAMQYAEKHPHESVVFLSVGFETTTPASCLAAKQAREKGLSNFSLLTANKTMDNAYPALRDSADAFLYPGHVHAIMGTKLGEELQKQGISGVITGFTAREILTALAFIVRKVPDGTAFFKNCYPRVVTPTGSKAAKTLMCALMEPCDAEWRGIGIIKQSGLRLKPDWAAFDARKIFSLPKMKGKTNPACRCGDILRGSCKPSDCPVFSKGCTPEHPIGACMVSHEGACSAYYQYGGNV